MNYAPPSMNQPMAKTTISQADWNAAKRRARLPNGISLAYVELGNPKGPPVLLIHGYTDSSRSWSLPAPHLADKHRLILVDLRGHGASSAPECCYTVSDMTYDLRLLLDHLKIDKVDFVGHSLGSMIGQVFAQRYSERLRKLVLVGSTLSVVKAGAPGSWLWENVHALTDPIDQGSSFIGEWTTNPMPVDAEFIGYERREACAIPTRIWRAVLQEMYVSEFGRLSSTITMPTLIVWGGKDPLFDAEDQAALRKTIKGAQFIAFDALGHNLQWEDPPGVAGAIAKFLEQRTESQRK
jgi:pimeloyl-ACP methyl ester carboxylesterase